MIEFELIDDTQTIEADLIDDTENIEVGIIKEIDKYPDLKELPSINDVTLIGNKTLNELGIQPEGDYATNTELNSGLATKVDKVTGKGLSTNDYTNEEKQKLSTLENYDDTEVRELIDTKQPRGNYLTEETDPTVPNYVKSITQSNITSWNNKADKSEIPDVSNFATKTELNNETTNRENTDHGLQEQIDAITSSSDVKDIVGTYTELQNYDTSTLGNDDIIKVLQDNTHNNAMTYYRWIISEGAGSWQYVGQEGPYYTKSETETLLNNKQDEITSLNKLDSDLVDDINQTNKFVTENEKITWNTEIENLHEEDDLLKRNLQTTTGSGEEVTLEKTTELDFVKPPLPRGNTKQDTTTGKNLLNTIDADTTTTNGVTYYRNKGVYYLSGTNTKTDAVWVLPNTQNTNLPTFEIGQTYTMSFKGTLPNGIYAQLNAVKTSTGTQYNLGSVRNTATSTTFTIDSDYSRTAQLFIGVQPTATNVNCNFTIQIEKGSTATSYEPYTGGIPSPNPDYMQEIRNVTGNVEVTISNENNTESKTLPVSLGNIELCKIGNYQDYLYKNNGKWYKYNAINKLVLNGSENWGLQSINSYGIANFQKSQSIDTIAGQSNLSFCDTFSPQTTLISATKDIGYFLNTAKVLFIRFNSSIANTAAIFKTWLSQHNVTLYYVLGTARSTEITDATLISQLEEISKTLSYQGQTNITSNTIAMFDVEAYQDLKIILDEKYVKPSTGIPKTDLASAVQTSLGKADTAVQKDGGSAVQTIALSSGTGTTALGVKSRAASSYLSFTNSSTWLGSIGVTSDKKPTFYNGASYMLAYTSDIPTNTSDLTNDSNYVTNTDYATSTTGGVVRVYNSDGFAMNNGVLIGAVKTNQQYEAGGNWMMVCKGTLENVLTGRQYLVPSDITGKQDITDNNLQTTNKTITSAINEVNSVAKGANQAVGYNSYSDMITAINAMDDEEFSMGQNIYVITVEVPDLWISSVESTSSTYTYVDDATVINELNTNGYIQVGYYKLSMLETQKVDLTNYVTNTDYASITKGGVIKVSSGYGLDITANGTLYPLTKTYEQYQSALEQTVIGKGTLENVIAGKDLAPKSIVPKYYIGTSATAAATRLKVVECEGFVLEEGATISVTFTNAQTYNGSPQLNVNDTGAIIVQSRAGTNGVRYLWSAGEIIDFTYDGTYWVCHGRGFATTSYYGVTKLSTSAASDSQAYALTPRSLYYFANYSIAPYYSSSKTYAVGDKVRYAYYIYECITAIDTPEAWTAAHWQQLDTIQEQIDNKIWSGTEQQYDDLAEIKPDTLYCITE